MAGKPTGRPNGRPKKIIDKKQFETLCGLQCTLLEIACAFDCSEDTIERWCNATYGKTFADVYRVKRGKGKISLRRAQFQMAQKNPTMAIWLGKQWLGQTDKNEAVVAVISDETREAVEELIKGLDENDGGTGDSDI